ncbi:MAG: histidine phosphatase family protein [Candidatus Parvarchaeota archaeon]|nr:histidine phosphatase family protein [Candidatus Parvarchaeota archaeon]MCW1294798.1 histidine phosphatase family protein [Candidatus Parvarchaeum tengchongense]MCW1295252.1 histidine phosphatase family protein [Candidatus Parvarchaeum tengchongense]MCW1299486.1 histidine phosphatase family protein [Candidatus Parvarchaeum tengchongense]MCW1311945.1 histidine phosphatase family protein [Candidatus Parvarchaeum tengchongense]
MGIIIIIRHGFSESNKKGYLTHDIDGYPLTVEGEKYLIKSAEELKKLDNIKEIISSPILRATQTAGIISKITGLKVKKDERLKERQMGNYNNKHIPEDNKGDQIDYNWHVKEILNGYPNGLESWEEVEKRVTDLLKEIPEDENVILVSHGDIIKAVIAYFLDLDEFGVWGIRANHGHFTILDSKNKRILAIGAPVISDAILDKIKHAIKENE